MRYRLLVCLVLVAVTFASLSSCGDDITSPDGQGPPSGGSKTLNGSAIFDSLVIAPNDTLVVYRNSGEIPTLRVLGDARIDGVLRARSGELSLIVEGDLVVDGEIDSSVAPSNLAGRPYGLSIVVNERLTFGRSSVVKSTGDVLVTNLEADLELDREDLTAAATGVETERVPIAFVGGGAAVEPADTTNTATLAGTWTITNDAWRTNVFAVRLQNTPVLRINDWVVVAANGPTPPTLTNDDNRREADAGGSGGDLVIDVPDGSIVLDARVAISLGHGGRGADADKTQWSGEIVAGAGGRPGGLVVRAGGSIEVGTAHRELLVDPGRGGDGGDALTGTGATYPITNVDTGQGYARDHEARGGEGGDAGIRVRIEGATSGLEVLRIGPLVGGDGGAAEAHGESAGPAPEVIALVGPDGSQAVRGGHGSNVRAVGGSGGSARLELLGVPSIRSTSLRGGRGGDAEAIAGNGNDSGNLPFFRGAAGGKGGDAEARGGAGGDATDVPQLAVDREGGIGGNARASAGSGGNGGDSAIVPGAAGPAGASTAVAGLGGRGLVTAVSGTTVAEPGVAGIVGRQFNFRTARLSLADLADVEGPLDDVTRTVRILDDQGIELGTCELDFSDFFSDDPSFIRWDDDRGVLVFHYEFYALNNRVAPEITLRINGFSEGVLDPDFTGLIVIPHDANGNAGLAGWPPRLYAGPTDCDGCRFSCWRCGQLLLLEGNQIPRNALDAVDPEGKVVTFRRSGGADLWAMIIGSNHTSVRTDVEITVELLGIEVVLAVEE